MIISHRHRFIFVHIPKTAGEAVTAALEPVLGPDDIVLKGEADAWLRAHRDRRYRDLGGIGKHSKARVVRAAFPEEWDDYLTFTVVRHPVDRLISFYRYLGTIAARRDRPRPQHLWFRLTAAGRRADPDGWEAMRVYRRTTSFSEFLQPPDGSPNRLLLPQASYVSVQPDDRPIVDVVGRFENLAEDFRQVTTRLGLDDLRLPKRNQSSARAQLAPDRVSATAADGEFLARRYAKDFRLFGYDPPPTPRT